MNRHLGPDGDRLSVPMGRLESELASPPDRRRVERLVTTRLEDPGAVHRSTLAHPDPEDGGALDLFVPERERIFDGNLFEERHRLPELALGATPRSEEGRR